MNLSPLNFYLVYPVAPLVRVHRVDRAGRVVLVGRRVRVDQLVQAVRGRLRQLNYESTNRVTESNLFVRLR